MAEKVSLEVEGWTADQEKERLFRFIDAVEVQSLEKKFIPKNTDSSTKWALSNFLSWRDKRNAVHPGNQVPPDLLVCSDATVLSKWLTLYVAETRKRDGGQYPPKSIYSLLTGLLRHMRCRNVSCPNFLDTGNPKFASFHNALDNVFRQLRSKGVGAEARQTEALSKEDEEALWKSGVLGYSSPKHLLRTVFFLNGKNFCLRGGAEQRDLKISQLKRLTDPPMYVYTENHSKNRAGGLTQMRIKNKTVPIVAVPESGDRCYVAVLDAYLAKLPTAAFEKDNFYVQPAMSYDASKPWFTANPIGRNTLNNMVKEICRDGEIAGEKTNHSLRATGESTLFQAGVPEKIIQERSGHLSLNGLRQYQRTTLGQQEVVSKLLTSNLTVEKKVVVAQPTPVPSMNFYSCSVVLYNNCNGPPPQAPCLPLLETESCIEKTQQELDI